MTCCCFRAIQYAHESHAIRDLRASKCAGGSQIFQMNAAIVAVLDVYRTVSGGRLYSGKRLRTESGTGTDLREDV